MKGYNRSTADNEYSITFNSEHNLFHESSEEEDGIVYDIETFSQQLVTFTYAGIIGQVSEGWHEITPCGFFENITRINGISDLNIKFKTEGINFKIQWSENEDFGNMHSQNFTSKNSFYFNFNNYSPNYFRFVNSSEQNIVIESMTLNFACLLSYPTINITNEDSNKGDIYSSIPNGAWKAGETTFLIAAMGKEGYTFDGWYTPDNIKYSSDLILELKVMNEDIFLEARYKSVIDNEYKVFTLAGENGRTSEKEGAHKVGDNVTLSSIANDGYYSLGWFYVNYEQDENMESATYTFTMTNQDACYVTEFGHMRNIFYSVSPGDGEISGPNFAIEGDEVTLIATPNFQKEYAFNYWKNEKGEVVCENNVYTFTMPEHDLVLSAYFDKGIKLTVGCAETHGSCTGSGYYLEGKKVNITATAKNGYHFLGWTNNNTNEGYFSIETSLEYKMGSKDTVLYARFLDDEDYQNWVDSHGGKPIAYSSLNQISYGLYPQTHVNDTDGKLAKYAPDEDNVYFIYDGEYYIKDIASPYLEGTTFADDTPVIKGVSYFFKCEPIIWNIVSGGLDCATVLDAHEFDDNYQFYSSSLLRKWLNKDFYSKAFFLNSSYIKPSYLDDSLREEKIWIGSKDQYESWYKTVSTRRKKLTDFAISNYAFTENGDKRGYGTYWTRSSIGVTRSYYTYKVDNTGSISHSKIDRLEMGCSPTINIYYNLY